MIHQLVDAYAHVGLPRFQSAADWLKIMDQAAVTHAIVCPFETCPDLHEVHRTLVLAPDRIRAFGLALGREQTEVIAGMHGQLEAGFTGFRLSEGLLSDAPYVLEVVGERGAVPLVVGSRGLSGVASALLAHLERYPDGIVVSPHMAGPTGPEVISENAEVRELFEHPNFYVVMSRHSMVEKVTSQYWTEFLVRHVGWNRLMWGSEAPVLFWRDETLQQQGDWTAEYSPSPNELQDFLAGNALRAIFARVPRVQALNLPYEPFDHQKESPAPMFPRGFAADTRLPAKLVSCWMDAGGAETETLTSFTSRLLLEAVDAKLAHGESA